MSDSVSSNKVERRTVRRKRDKDAEYIVVDPVNNRGKLKIEPMEPVKTNSDLPIGYGRYGSGKEPEGRFSKVMKELFRRLP